MKTSFVFLAAGFEEIEALTVVDVLRRAGLPVKTVSITSSLQVTGAHGITVAADVLYDNTLFDEPLWLILPGGLPGADNLYDFAPLQGLLERQAKSADGKIAAICASPAVVLGRLGLLEGKEATCYPGFEDKMRGAHARPDLKVVIDGNIITGNGPANSLEFALVIVREALGVHIAGEVGSGMLYYRESPNDYNFG
ncbi:MAG: DJ-1/PfpI family protein [Muribaculaceae bacterium]|nr:DJ-1/PfpI family protein [Muribaculaceae bacterium]